MFECAATELGGAVVWRCFGLSGSIGFLRSASCAFGGGSLWAFGLCGGGGGGASVASASSFFGRVRDLYLLRPRGRWDVGLEFFGGLHRRRIRLRRLRCCDRRWGRQIGRLVDRRGRIGRWDGLGLGHLRPWRDILRRRWRSDSERRQVDHNRGRRSVRDGFGLAPVESRPGRSQMNKSHDDRRYAPAKRGKRLRACARSAIARPTP